MLMGLPFCLISGANGLHKKKKPMAVEDLVAFSERLPGDAPAETSDNWQESTRVFLFLAIQGACMNS
jgi:hypothetical protein